MSVNYSEEFLDTYYYYDLPNAPVEFPGVKPGNFNFEAEWVVVGYIMDERKVIVNGTQENWQLQFIDYDTPDEFEYDLDRFPPEMAEYNAEVLKRIEAGEITPQQATELFEGSFFIEPEFFLPSEWLDSHPNPGDEETASSFAFLDNPTPKQKALLDELADKFRKDNPFNDLPFTDLSDLPF